MCFRQVKPNSKSLAFPQASLHEGQDSSLQRHTQLPACKAEHPAHKLHASFNFTTKFNTLKHRETLRTNQTKCIYKVPEITLLNSVCIGVKY